MNDSYHQPVLLNESIHYLDPQPGKRFIDATLGGGGHTLALLKVGAMVLAIDRDPDAIAHAREHTLEFLAACPKLPSGAPGYGSRNPLALVQGNFADLDRIAAENSFTQVDGLILDLGVSSHQLEKAGRGFSFTQNGPLDMRMDPLSQGVTAADLVNSLSENELIQLFQKNAGEPWARPIAHALIIARRLNPIKTTEQLSDIVQSVKPYRGKANPATKVFQALRMAVNTELENLGHALEVSLKVLGPKGVLVVLSFHSGEDRLVKNFFNSHQEFLKILTKRPIVPAKEEIAKNPRARSAKMRVAQKL